MINEETLPTSLTLLQRLKFPKKLGLLESIFGDRLRQYGVCWVKCANGISWKLNLADPCHRWIVYGKYEGGHGIDLAYSMLKNGGVYIDSGANIGQWMLYLSHIHTLKTLAFEPICSERLWLKECVDLQSEWNVEVLDCGLSDENTYLDIQVNGPRSTLQLDWYSTNNLERENIPVKKLDDLLHSRGVKDVTFWKLDVEGAELKALLGAKDYLQQQKIKCVYFECHPSDFREILSLFKLFNYRIYELIKNKLTPKSDDSITGTQDLVAMPD